MTDDYHAPEFEALTNALPSGFDWGDPLQPETLIAIVKALGMSAQDPVQVVDSDRVILPTQWQIKFNAVSYEDDPFMPSQCLIRIDGLRILFDNQKLAKHALSRINCAKNLVISIADN